MTGYRYDGTDAARYVTARFDYLFSGLPHMQGLDDVIWARGREALTLRTELSALCRRIVADAGYVAHSLERSAVRSDDGHGFVYQPSDRASLVDSVEALNARERELEELCRAAEFLGHIADDVPGESA